MTGPTGTNINDVRGILFNPQNHSKSYALSICHDFSISLRWDQNRLFQVNSFASYTESAKIMDTG